jgi:nicotinamide riboside transporter PnuC
MIDQPATPVPNKATAKGPVPDRGQRLEIIRRTAKAAKAECRESIRLGVADWLALLGVLSAILAVVRMIARGTDRRLGPGFSLCGFVCFLAAVVLARRSREQMRLTLLVALEVVSAILLLVASLRFLFPAVF